MGSTLVDHLPSRDLLEGQTFLEMTELNGEFTYSIRFGAVVPRKEPNEAQVYRERRNGTDDQECQRGERRCPDATEDLGGMRPTLGSHGFDRVVQRLRFAILCRPMQDEQAGREHRADRRVSVKVDNGTRPPWLRPKGGANIIPFPGGGRLACGFLIVAYPVGNDHDLL